MDLELFLEACFTPFLSVHPESAHACARASTCIFGCASEWTSAPTSLSNRWKRKSLAALASTAMHSFGTRNGIYSPVISSKVEVQLREKKISGSCSINWACRKWWTSTSAHWLEWNSREPTTTTDLDSLADPTLWRQTCSLIVGAKSTTSSFKYGSCVSLLAVLSTKILLLSVT